MRKKLDCVLLVDDYDSDNFIHKRILNKAGIADRVEVALNGKEALEFLRNSESSMDTKNSHPLPELIFLDINMPVMDGWEFLEEYMKSGIPHKKEQVIIVLTTSLNPEDKARAERILGCDCFRYKPLTFEMLTEIIGERFPQYL